MQLEIKYQMFLLKKQFKQPDRNEIKKRAKENLKYYWSMTKIIARKTIKFY